jgi:hypothetical protein
VTKQIKTPNGYITLHRSTYHNHIALKEGKIFIYDNSGRDPDETDDGPLWIRTSMVKEIEVMPGDFGPYAIIPVQDQRLWEVGGVSSYKVHVDLEGAIKLGRRLDVKVNMVTNIYDPKPKS